MPPVHFASDLDGRASDGGRAASDPARCLSDWIGFVSDIFRCVSHQDARLFNKSAGLSDYFSHLSDRQGLFPMQPKANWMQQEGNGM